MTAPAEAPQQTALRQQVLVLYLASSALDARVVGWSTYDGTGGTWPRHLAFSKDGLQLYAGTETSDTIAVFTVDQSSGALTATGTPLDWPKPVCVLPY